MSDAEQSESTTEKGDRHENEAKSILKHFYGAGVEKVDAWGRSDPFGFVDLIAMRPGDRVKFVQVKTNRFTAKDRRKYRRRTKKLPPGHAEFEVWVRLDREGWELHSYDPEVGEFDHFWSIDVCDSSEAGQQYRSFMKEQQELVTDGSGRERGALSITDNVQPDE